MTTILPRKSPLPCPNSGFIYIMTNDSMPGLLKVGCTSRHPDLRALELSSGSGIATPFIVVFISEVSDINKAESAAHTALQESRVSAEREFFRMTVDEAIDAIAKVISTHVIVRPIKWGRCRTCGASLNPETIAWDVVSGPFWCCENCGADVEGIRATSDYFVRVRHEVELRQQEIDKKIEDLRLGRCPKCSNPVFQVEKITVIGSAGKSAFRTNCPNCDTELRAVADKGSRVTHLTWEIV